MNKINRVGEKLMQYREEFHKDYPDIIKEAMVDSLEKMISDGKIKDDAMLAVMNKSHTRKTFEEFLMDCKEYVKTQAEIRIELEGMRNSLDDLLDCVGITDVETDIDEDNESLLVVKPLVMSEEFAMNYFGVNEDSLVKLMKKGGFIEIFVSLRLTKVLSDIIKESSEGLSHIKLSHSLPYPSHGGSGYVIDLIMEIKADTYENVDLQQAIVTEIKRVGTHSEDAFSQKMLV